jgi:hypothetical protein
MFTVGELEIGSGFVADFEPFKLNDAYVGAAAFPNLALFKFHARASYFFLPATCLAATTVFGG